MKNVKFSSFFLVLVLIILWTQNVLAWTQMLSKSHISLEECRDNIIKYNIKYPDYYRSECFKWVDKNYYYNLCDNKEDCNIEDNKEINDIKNISNSNPYEKSFSKESLEKLEKIISNLLWKKDNISWSEFNKLLKNFDDKLINIKNKYPKNQKYLNLVNYLIYETEKLYLDFDIKNSWNSSSSQKSDNFLEIKTFTFLEIKEIFDDWSVTENQSKIFCKINWFDTVVSKIIINDNINRYLIYTTWIKEKLSQDCTFQKWCIKEITCWITSWEKKSCKKTDTKSNTTIEKKHWDSYNLNIGWKSYKLTCNDWLFVTLFSDFNDEIINNKLISTWSIQLNNDLVDDTSDYNPKETVSCYQNNIYWFDSNNKPTEIKEKCGLEKKYWPVNSFCEINSKGQVQTVSYPEVFETRCVKTDNGEATCVSKSKDNPANTYNVEKSKAKKFTFTKSYDLYKSNTSKYYYFGEPQNHLINWKEYKDYYFVDPNKPQIKNKITTSSVYWEWDILKKDKDNSLARVPTRILSDLKPFYKQNNIEPKNIVICKDQDDYESTFNYCENLDTLVVAKNIFEYTWNCIQSFSDSYYYTNKKLLSAKCEKGEKPTKVEIKSTTKCSSNSYCSTDMGIEYCAVWPWSSTLKKYESRRKAIINSFKDTKYEYCNVSFNLDDSKPLCCDNWGCAARSSCFPQGHISSSGHVGPIDSPKYWDLTVKYQCQNNHWIIKE